MPNGGRWPPVENTTGFVRLARLDTKEDVREYFTEEATLALPGAVSGTLDERSQVDPGKPLGGGDCRGFRPLFSLTY